MLKRSHSRYLLPAFAGLGLAGLVATAAFAKDWHHGWRHGGQRTLQQMDADGDGSVTRAEIEAFQSARATEIDADKDGRITVEEIIAFHEKQRRQHMSERLLRMDEDGDGAVSVEEHQEAHTWWLARLDRDGDGVIAEDEMERHGPMRRHHRRHWQDGDGIE